VGGPERIGIEGCVSVADDRVDRAFDARRIPRFVDQGLELRWFVEDRASL
jgi:hypothetical protein